MGEDEIQAMKESVPEQFRPNADMSLREQYAQYAYGRTIAEVMRDPEREGSEIIAAAARAGMDVVFGEHHAYAEETNKQIRQLMGALPAHEIKAIVLEVPVEMQDILEPSVVETLSYADFIRGLFELDNANLYNEASAMLSEGAIGQAQFDWLNDNITAQAESMSTMNDQDILDRYGARCQPFYDMVVDATEKGIPVVAADLDRQRAVAAALQAPRVPPDMRMDEEEALDLMLKGLDDTSDFEHLKSLGINSADPGILVVHRGYHHINGIQYRDAPEGHVAPQTHGFDDLLENEGRDVLTVSVIAVHDKDGDAKFQVTDPADIHLLIDDMTVIMLYNGLETEMKSDLDRSDYIQEQPQEKSAPVAPALPKLD